MVYRLRRYKGGVIDAATEKLGLIAGSLFF
jgi:hypothetical protein